MRYGASLALTSQPLLSASKPEGVFNAEAQRAQRNAEGGMRVLLNGTGRRVDTARALN